MAPAAAVAARRARRGSSASRPSASATKNGVPVPAVPPQVAAWRAPASAWRRAATTPRAIPARRVARYPSSAAGTASMRATTASESSGVAVGIRSKQARTCWSGLASTFRARKCSPASARATLRATCSVITPSATRSRSSAGVTVASSASVARSTAVRASIPSGE